MHHLGSPLIPEDQRDSPDHDHYKLQPKAYNTANDTWDISWRISRFEDLTSGHVPDTVPDEGKRRGQRPLRSAGHVARNQSPR